MSNILKTIDLADGRAVLFDAAIDDYRAQNLTCFAPDGTVRWQASLPANTGPDSFVDIAIDEDAIRAITWSGWSIWFNPVTGTENKSRFVK
jgi:hypothetical protein